MSSLDLIKTSHVSCSAKLHHMVLSVSEWFQWFTKSTTCEYLWNIYLLCLHH